jgi:hypothetical protein
MQHPFINNLSEKTLEEIQEGISSLMNKLTFAYRTGNQPLIQQLHMALESYKSEQSKKFDELMKKQNIQTKINIQKEGQN